MYQAQRADLMRRVQYIAANSKTHHRAVNSSAGRCRAAVIVQGIQQPLAVEARAALSGVPVGA
jgi:hypothetical protein